MRSSAPHSAASWWSRAGRERARRPSPCTAPRTCSTHTASPWNARGSWSSGPNPLFLRYIEQVLPSLGETGVSLSTVAGLVPEVRVKGTDDPAVGKLKGDVRMVKVLERAVRTRQRPLRHDIDVPFGAGVLRLRAKTTEEIVALARRRPGTHNVRRRFVEAHVLRALADDYRARLARGIERLGEADGLPDDVAAHLAADIDAAAGPSAEEQAELARRLRRTPQVAEALDRMWPRLSPHELLHDLLGARPLLAAAGQGILSSEAIRRLYRPRSSALDQVPWTVADAALIDEARTILGPRRGGARPNRPRAGRVDEGNAQEGGFWPQGLASSPMPTSGATLGPEDDIRSFGHIVVDEVQDLSPMQLRMLARRSLSGSMTVVGDMAQATGPWAPESWDDVTRHLSPQRATRLVELTVSYRTPAEVIVVAARVLAVAAPGISPPRPVRQSGFTPRIIAASRAGLAEAVARATREEVAAVTPGRVAVLGPAVMLPELARALSDAGLDPTDPRDPRWRRPGRRSGAPSGRRDERLGIRLGRRGGAGPGGRGRGRSGRRTAAGGHDEGTADSLCGAHPADPAPGHRPRRATAGRLGGTGRLTQLAPRRGAENALTCLLAREGCRRLKNAL